MVIEERIAALQAEKEILLQKRAATQNAFDSSRRVLGVAETAFREGGGEVFAPPPGMAQTQRPSCRPENRELERAIETSGG